MQLKFYRFSNYHFFIEISVNEKCELNFTNRVAKKFELSIFYVIFLTISFCLVSVSFIRRSLQSLLNRTFIYCAVQYIKLPGCYELYKSNCLTFTSNFNESKLLLSSSFQTIKYSIFLETWLFKLLFKYTISQTAIYWGMQLCSFIRMSKNHHFATWFHVIIFYRIFHTYCTLFVCLSCT